MKIRFKKLNDKAVMPTKAHPTDAGYDLVATSEKYEDNGVICYGTGIAVEIPEGYVGLIFPRSSNAKKDLLLTNSVGVIDSGYRGEIMAKFRPVPVPERYGNDCMSGFRNVYYACEYYVGDRIAQLIIMPIPEVEFEEADELSDSERGTGGYGSTGK